MSEQEFGWDYGEWRKHRQEIEIIFERTLSVTISKFKLNPQSAFGANSLVKYLMTDYRICKAVKMDSYSKTIKKDPRGKKVLEVLEETIQKAMEFTSQEFHLNLLDDSKTHFIGTKFLLDFYHYLRMCLDPDIKVNLFPFSSGNDLKPLPSGYRSENILIFDTSNNKHLAIVEVRVAPKKKTSSIARDLAVLNYLLKNQLFEIGIIIIVGPQNSLTLGKLKDLKSKWSPRESGRLEIYVLDESNHTIRI